MLALFIIGFIAGFGSALTAGLYLDNRYQKELIDKLLDNKGGEEDDTP